MGNFLKVIKAHERLNDIFENELDQTSGAVIAITGPWGVGKTYFWNNYINEEVEKEKRLIENFYYECSKVSYEAIYQKKYAYISLFGIESLDDIKSALYEKLYFLSPGKKTSILQKLKLVAASLKNTQINYLGLNFSTKLLDTILFSSIKDSIICFDDFERLSDKLSIKDIMGFINFLKLERNCQIIIILHERQTIREKKTIYLEYKEKLIDHEIKINTIEHIIHLYSEDIDKQLINIIIDFSDKLDIKSLRFYIKVIKLYKKFIEEMSPKIAYISKEVIFLRIMQGYFIEDFGSAREYNWGDSCFYHEEDKKEWSTIKLENYSKLTDFSYIFQHTDNWASQFQNWFLQSQDYTQDKIRDLVESDLITEKNLKLQSEIKNLLFQLRNINLEPNFCAELYRCAEQLIGITNLDNLNFYRILLIKFNNKKLSLMLKKKIKVWIDKTFMEIGFKIQEEIFRFDKSNIFHRYIRVLTTKFPQAGLPSLHQVIKNYVINDGWSDKDGLVLELSTKQDWYILLFESIPDDMDFNSIDKMRVIQKIINQMIRPELKSQITTDILSILADEAQKSNFKRLHIDYILSKLET